MPVFSQDQSCGALLRAYLQPVALGEFGSLPSCILNIRGMLLLSPLGPQPSHVAGVRVQRCSLKQTCQWVCGTGACGAQHGAHKQKHGRATWELALGELVAEALE